MLLNCSKNDNTNTLGIFIELQVADAMVFEGKNHYCLQN